MLFVANLKKGLNLYFIGFIAIYVGNLLLANAFKLFNTHEVLAVFFIVGLLFSGVSFFLSKNSSPIIANVHGQKHEIYVLFALQIFISIALIFGNTIIFSNYPDLSRAKEIITLVRKVLIFVVIPFLVYRQLFGFKPADFGLSTDWKLVFTKRNLLIFAVISSLFVLLNYFGGNGARPLREGSYSTAQLLIAAPLLFLWLFVEVGLVEEFFFRGMLQNRLSVFLRSNIGAICITSLVFGIVHAPGMYFRGAGVSEGLGSSPSFLTVMGYCIAIQAVPGFFLGIIWSKTRNLWLLMGIHAMIDLVPSLPAFIETWHI